MNTYILQQRAPDVANLEGPQIAEHIHEEDPQLLENVSKVKDLNEGRVS